MYEERDCVSYVTFSKGWDGGVDGLREAAQTRLPNDKKGIFIPEFRMRGEAKDLEELANYKWTDMAKENSQVWMEPQPPSRNSGEQK